MVRLLCLHPKGILCRAHLFQQRTMGVYGGRAKAILLVMFGPGNSRSFNAGINGTSVFTEMGWRLQENRQFSRSHPVFVDKCYCFGYR